MFLTKLGRKLARLTEFMDNPGLFRIWRQGIAIDVWGNLNQTWLTTANINTVLDIGANTGQFARLIHEVLPAAIIYSFEPLEDCYEELKQRMQNVDTFTAFNIALGDTDEELDFHRNSHSQSSSVLPMADLHKQNYPFTTKESITKVRSTSLDDVAKELKIDDNLLIKIDVQGLEDRVIAGGKHTIELAAILIIETSFQHLYVGQPLFEDICELLKEKFRYMGALTQNRSSIDGSVLYADSIFLRR